MAAPPPNPPAGPPPAPPAPLPTSIENLPPEIIMGIFDLCEDFEETELLRRSSIVFYSVFQDRSNTILTNMARRMLGDAVELAKEILIYQRFTVDGIPNYFSVSEALREMRANGGSTVLRTSDIKQLKENHKFYLRFRRHYQGVLAWVTYPGSGTNIDRLYATLRTETLLNHRVLHRRGRSLQYEVGADVTMEQFYKVWLLIWRFKYQTVTEFSGNEVITPEETGRLHYIAFIMDSCRYRRPFIVSGSGTRVPANIQDAARLEANTVRIINAWRDKSFMGTWFPLKVHSQGIFSAAFLAGTWEAVVQQGLKGYMYLRGSEWGEFTRNQGGSHLLYWKMLCHLAARVSETQPVVQGEPNSWHAEFLLVKARFDIDFETVTTEKLITKYHLD